MTAYEKIFLLNTLIGNKGVRPLSPEFWSEVRNQTELVVEEAGETLDACIEEDMTELIDGVADIMVVAIGLFQKLQLCGIDIDEALQLVCDNNLEKFHSTAEHANETLESFREKGVETFVRLSTMEDGTEYYAVIRKSDGKMLKPHDFVGVDLSEVVSMAAKMSEIEGE